MQGAGDTAVSLVMMRKQAGETFETSLGIRLPGLSPRRYRCLSYGAENPQLALTLAGPVTALPDSLG